MSVQVENLEKSMAKLTIEVSAEKLEEALQEAYNRQKNRISLPGFRKGKVPRNMVEKMYGPEIFYEDAANLLIQKEYGAAVKESGEDVVSQPEIDIVQLEKGTIHTDYLYKRIPYESGALLCFLFDELGIPNWQQKLNAQTEENPVTLYDILNEYLN